MQSKVGVFEKIKKIDKLFLDWPRKKKKHKWLKSGMEIGSFLPTLQKLKEF